MAKAVAVADTDTTGHQPFDHLCENGDAILRRFNYHVTVVDDPVFGSISAVDFDSVFPTNFHQ